MAKSEYEEAQIRWAKDVNEYLHELLMNKWIDKEWMVVLQDEGEYECELIFKDCIFSVPLGIIAKLNDKRLVSGYVKTIKWEGKERPCLRIC